MLGSGDHEYERFLQLAMVRHPNFLFLRGYSDELSQALYASGDLFLMPSVFEPCGISQLLAMRAGQPVVAHAVGGLKDTVTDEVGFPFSGADSQEQARNFVHAVASAVELKLGKADAWQALGRAASAQRFSWDASAERYLTEVYGFAAHVSRHDVHAG
jgi:starch synthase